MLYRNPDYDPSDVEAAIQRMYDEERAERFAKFGLVGKIAYSLLNPDYFFVDDSKVEIYLERLENWDLLGLGKFK